MLGLFKSYATHALIVAVMVAAGVAAWQYTNVLALKAALSDERLERAEEKKNAAARLAAAEKKHREIEAARQTARDLFVESAKKESAHANTVAADALRERDLLREQITRLTARTPRPAANSPTAAGSPPADPPGGVHARADGPGTDAIELIGRMLSESDEMAGELAKAVGASRVAGLTCERLYDRIHETQ